MATDPEFQDPADFDFAAQQLARRRKIAESLMGSPMAAPTIRAGGRDIVNVAGVYDRFLNQTQGNREIDRVDAQSKLLDANQARVARQTFEALGTPGSKTLTQEGPTVDGGNIPDQQIPLSPEEESRRRIGIMAKGQAVPSIRAMLQQQMAQEFDVPERERVRKANTEAAAAEKEQNRAFLAGEHERDRQNKIDLRQMPTQHITISGGGRAGAGGPAGFGGAAPVIGADEQGAPIYRHTKSGQLFQFDEQGQPAPYRGAVGAKPAPDKPLTDSQAKDVIYGTRAAQAQNILDEVGMTYSPIKLDMVRGAERIPGGRAAANSFVLGASEQKIDQAQRNFINAVLRRESGAVISPEEFNNARKQYFPEPGDQPATLEQKRKNRDLVISGLATGAGAKGAKEVEKERANKSPEARAMVGSKAEFDALPAGAKWQTPDGRKGTK